MLQKINKLIPKKEKKYPFTTFGFVKMLHERNEEIKNRFSKGGYYVILILLLAFGLLSKEFIIAIAVNEGISKVAYYVIN